MLRLALVVPGYERGGGVPTVAEFLRAALMKTGRYDIELFSLSTSWRDPESTRITRPREWFCAPRLGRVEVGEGVRAVRIGARFAEWELQRYRPSEGVRKALAGFDLIQVVAGSGVWVGPCLELGRPVYLQVATTLAAERRAATRTRDWRSMVQRLNTALAGPLECRGLREAAGVFVENRWMEDYVRTLRHGQGVHFAPPGVDTDFFHPEPSAERRHVLFVGRMDDPRKNLELLLRAFGRYRARQPEGANLILAGYRAPLEEHRRLISELGLSSQVMVRTGLSREELRSLYQTARLVALSSNEEGLGMVLVEAMACGTAVVSTDCGGPATIVRHGENGFLVPVGDVETFTTALEKLLTNSELQFSMGKKARETAATDFSLEAAGRRFTAVYDNDALMKRVGPQFEAVH